VISLQPDWIGRSVLGPAVTAVYGAPVEVEVGFWHGVTPMVLLSAAVVGTGALLFVFWRPIHQRLRRQTLVDRYDAETAWESVLRGIDALGAATARRIQHGDLRGYLWVVIASAAALAAWGLLGPGPGPRLPDAGAVAGLRIGPAVVALVGLAAGVAAARARTLLSTMIAVGLTGFVAALTFLLNGAPDLALTQFAVESLIVVLLTVALFILPLAAPPTRTKRERALDAGLSAGFAAVLFVVLLDMGMGAPPTDVSGFYAARSYLEAFGRNVVNVILVDFRGVDTLGETTVIALAAVFAWSLLGPRTAQERAARTGGGHGAFILLVTSRIFFWLLAGSSVLILLRGHNEIGGGFVGGLAAALAFAVVSLADGVGRARSLLRVHPLALAGGGLLLAVASGLPGLFLHGDFLSSVWLEADLFGIHVKQGTTLVFDLGVYLVVLGGVLAFLFGLRREAAR
jgi:multicomponent Na+:H+ antiporter subunit A